MIIEKRRMGLNDHAALFNMRFYLVMSADKTS